MSTDRLYGQTTSLYRFYDASDVLLYVGITNSVPRRLDQHGDDKPWFAEAARVTLEHFPDRRSALEAEKQAIIAEKPRYNVVHNRGGDPRRSKPGGGRWRFETRRFGTQHRTDLWLYPELHCSSMVDDYHYLDGEGQLTEYVRYLEEREPELLERDAVPVYWSVRGDGIYESAPFSHLWDNLLAQDFLTFFTWPYDAATGDDLDWFRLPVRIDRFPSFADALAWRPSPFQRFCPLRSVIESRDAYVNWEVRRHLRDTA